MFSLLFQLRRYMVGEAKGKYILSKRYSREEN